MLDNLIKNLEKRAKKLTDFCDHFPPEIYELSGEVLNEFPDHDCGKPRLQIMVGLKNRPFPRLIEEARADFDASRTLFPGIVESERRKTIATAFGIDEALL